MQHDLDDHYHEHGHEHHFGSAGYGQKNASEKCFSAPKPINSAAAEQLRDMVRTT